MNIGDIFDVEIIDEDINGNGIAKIDNFVIFIKNALFKEVLRIKIVEIDKRFAVGEIVEFLSKSTLRIENVCDKCNLCGGCNFLHTNYVNERSIKKKYLDNLFGCYVDYLESNNIYNYRNKVVLHVKNNVIGFYNSKTHDICEIDNCYLLDNKINETINLFKGLNLSSVSEIMIRVISNEVMVNVICDKFDYDIDVDSLYVNGKYIKGKKYLVDSINDLKFTIYPESFYQINREGMSLIYDKASLYASSGNRLLDLYCGTGTIGMWMKDNFNEIVGCEINESSILNAKLNLELNNISNMKFVLSDAKNIKGKYDVVVVDPPRSGLSKDVVSFLDNSSALRIIYISCNPKTLKRDISMLNNYFLSEISACDMFPRTKHIECVALLERK